VKTLRRCSVARSKPPGSSHGSYLTGVIHAQSRQHDATQAGNPDSDAAAGGGSARPAALELRTDCVRAGARSQRTLTISVLGDARLQLTAASSVPKRILTLDDM
jgi:hypothetical protein